MMKLRHMLLGTSAVCLFVWCFHSNNATAGDSIVINCDPNIEPGVIIMTNPPKVSCSDLDLFNVFVGTGLKFGPITDMKQLEKQIAELQPPVLLDPIPKAYHFGPPAPVQDSQEKTNQEKTKFEVRRERAFEELSELNADQKLSDHNRWLRSVAPGYLDDSYLWRKETPINDADAEGS